MASKISTPIASLKAPVVIVLNLKYLESVNVSASSSAFKVIADPYEFVPD